MSEAHYDLNPLLVSYSSDLFVLDNEDDFDDFEANGPLLAQNALPQGVQCLCNAQSNIILLGKYAIKIHRYHWQLAREWTYYENRASTAKLSPNELIFYGGVNLADLCRYGIEDWEGYGLVLERIDMLWLGCHFAQYPLPNDFEVGLRLPLVERITACMFLRQSANWLRVDHGQINDGDLVIIMQDNVVVRACIIDHGDQPSSPGHRNIDELNSAMHAKGLRCTPGYRGVISDWMRFSSEKVFLLLWSDPLTATKNLRLILKDIWYRFRISQSLRLLTQAIWFRLRYSSLMPGSSTKRR